MDPTLITQNPNGSFLYHGLYHGVGVDTASWGWTSPVVINGSLVMMHGPVALQTTTQGGGEGGGGDGRDNGGGTNGGSATTNSGGSSLGSRVATGTPVDDFGVAFAGLAGGDGAAQLGDLDGTGESDAFGDLGGT